MATKYIICNFRFDAAEWSRVLKTVRNEDLKVLAEAIGVDLSTLRNWRNMARTGEFNHPSMSNFILACNWLDVDPRQFFTL